MLREYNFFRMNPSGVIDTANAMRLHDDDSALTHARDMDHSGPVEIWTGKRRITIVPPRTDRRRAERRFV